ncbi:NUDIX domain-containing protein [Tumebacillus flagellatus]|uniref:ADP-ribose pyrophosphatase n=1 Tax=Tumebacillus flagellatus TaxID=1157490 RepID=A0A074LJN2_9BACL|nr:NUDIX hydrolase [Tumebacillus flagellatus]KEO82381.1 ADP-ribose pyrophosphatase [Tumebacillus flagellatus]
MSQNTDHLIEKQLDSETVYEGSFITVTVQTVELPNGKLAKRDVVLHPGAVTVLAITADDKILLVNQFRKATNRLLIETPAGKLEPGEDPLTSAKRELEEETGYQAAEWKHFSSFYTSPGFADELMHSYIATDLTKSQQNLDDDEFLDVLHVSAEEAEQMVQDGRIADAKTIALIYWWLRERAREGK